MRIGIIGSGNIGGTAARLFAEAGHEVAVSHAGGPESLKPLVEQLGPRARALTVREAASFGDVVLLAIPWRSRDQLPADRLVDKIVIDAMNPYTPDFQVYDLGESTSSEEVSHALPGARVVKAMNHLFAKDLASRGKRGAPMDERTVLFVASDDDAAKATVAALLDDIGFAPVDAGTLRYGGLGMQPGAPVYARPLTRVEARALLDRIEREGVEAASQPPAG